MFCSLVGGRCSGGADGCWGKFSFSTTGACSVVDGVDAGAAEICEHNVSFFNANHIFRMLDPDFWPTFGQSSLSSLEDFTI